MPPYRYLIRLRIQYTSDLLQDSSLSVTQVCHRSGFNSLSHFITTFHRHTGMSPSQYRRIVDWSRMPEGSGRRPKHSSNDLGVGTSRGAALAAPTS